MIFLKIFAIEAKQNRLWEDIIYVLLTLIAIMSLKKLYVETSFRLKEILVMRMMKNKLVLFVYTFLFHL